MLQESMQQEVVSIVLTKLASTIEGFEIRQKTSLAEI